MRQIFIAVLFASPFPALIVIDKGSCIMWAIGAILLGVLVYIVDRHGQAMFLPQYLVYPQSILMFGSFGSILPTLTHTFSFILISGCIWAITIRDVYIVCGFWVAIESAMEIIQHPNVTTYIELLSLDKNTLGESIYLYSLNGVFSLGDMAAVLVGSIFALLVIIKNTTAEN